MPDYLIAARWLIRETKSALSELAIAKTLAALHEFASQMPSATQIQDLLPGTDFGCLYIPKKIASRKHSSNIYTQKINPAVLDMIGRYVLGQFAAFGHDMVRLTIDDGEEIILYCSSVKAEIQAAYGLAIVLTMDVPVYGWRSHSNRISVF